jgi:uncharacterized protein (DUF1778 family)
MAARLKDIEDENWSQQTVSRAGLVKLMEAVEKPKPPTEKLKQLMRAHRDTKKENASSNR